MNFWDHHKAITCYYELLMSSVCQKYQLRQMEYDILMFLHHNPQYHTAADIVRVRNSTKSHVSTSLKVLEERGLIEKKVADGNKKHRTQGFGLCTRVRAAAAQFGGYVVNKRG